jgi:succinate dehydrogenase hydrophobic anchor subunit
VSRPGAPPASPPPAGEFRAGDRHAVPVRSPGVRGRYLAWLMVRLTGVLLSVLVLGHFALTHVVTDVARTDAAFIARRWGSALWLAWDWLMLTSAIAHGAAGIWIAIDDYTASGMRRRALQRLLVAVSAVLLALGTATISAAILG